jgi:hypothetical protein
MILTTVIIIVIPRKRRPHTFFSIYITSNFFPLLLYTIAMPMIQRSYSAHNMPPLSLSMRLDSLFIVLQEMEKCIEATVRFTNEYFISHTTFYRLCIDQVNLCMTTFVSYRNVFLSLAHIYVIHTLLFSLYDPMFLYNDPPKPWEDH